MLLQKHSIFLFTINKNSSIYIFFYNTRTLVTGFCLVFPKQTSFSVVNIKCRHLCNSDMHAAKCIISHFEIVYFISFMQDIRLKFIYIHINKKTQIPFFFALCDQTCQILFKRSDLSHLGSDCSDCQPKSDCCNISFVSKFKSYEI